MSFLVVLIFRTERSSIAVAVCVDFVHGLGDIIPGTRTARDTKVSVSISFDRILRPNAFILRLALGAKIGTWKQHNNTISQLECIFIFYNTSQKLYMFRSGCD